MRKDFVKFFCRKVSDHFAGYSRGSLRGGFTLIELMIAMTIFVIFTGIIINSYLSLVKMQREVNDYRIMYSEARQVFEKITSEIRGGSVLYVVGENYNTAVESRPILLVSKDGSRLVEIGKDGRMVGIVEKSLGSGCSAYYLNSSEIEVSELRFFVSPAASPYASDNVGFNSLQFQPKVTVYAKFLKRLNNGNSYNFDLQTTISSRVYADTLAVSGLGICNFSGFTNKNL